VSELSLFAIFGETVRSQTDFSFRWLLRVIKTSIRNAQAGERRLVVLVEIERLFQAEGGA
jgi:hypothetical protein